jgi:hypothetical protein
MPAHFLVTIPSLNKIYWGRSGNSAFQKRDDKRAYFHEFKDTKVTKVNESSCKIIKSLLCPLKI